MPKGKKQLSQKQQWIGVFIFSGIFFFGGIALSYFMVIQYVFKNYKVTSQWEEIPCKIISVGVGNILGKRGFRHSGGTTYSINAEYQYEYKGKQYLGDTFNYQQSLSSAFRSMKKKTVKKIKNQAHPTCYVNPNNPKESILYPKVNSESYLVLGMGIVFICIAPALIFKTQRMFKIDNSKSE